MVRATGKLAIAVLFGVFGAQSANALTVSFLDTTFDDADWTIAQEFASPGGTHTFGQDLTLGLGNPSPYRRMTHVIPNDPAADTFVNIRHRQLDWVYEPSVSGAIDHIDLSIDRIVFFATPSSGGAVGHGFILFQDGRLYFADLGAFTSTNWETRALTGLTSADFATGALHPDFSATASPITFGYLKGNTNTGRQITVELIHGVDNFAVTVFGVPEPALAILLIAVAGALVARRA